MHPAQIVIYGANGWLGRSAIAVSRSFLENSPEVPILLIGSKESTVAIDGNEFEILTQNQAYPLIKYGCMFLNAAFLRREKLQNIDTSKYIEKNLEISNFALQQIKSQKVKYFINLSSGAAQPYDVESLSISRDPYGSLKFMWEREFEQECRVRDTNFLNCRIYSILGRFINEFDNLAISSFIKQAKSQDSLFVKAPNCKRTYVDAEQLVTLLFQLVLRERNRRIDSGGTLTSLGDLASAVLELVELDKEKLESGIDVSPDYYGNYQEFNRICEDFDLRLLDLRAQIKKTLPAFL
jgi:nucleoside-diphosphate-sugar epimerase